MRPASNRQDLPFVDTSFLGAREGNGSLPQRSQQPFSEQSSPGCYPPRYAIDDQHANDFASHGNLSTYDLNSRNAFLHHHRSPNKPSLAALPSQIRAEMMLNNAHPFRRCVYLWMWPLLSVDGLLPTEKTFGMLLCVAGSSCSWLANASFLNDPDPHVRIPASNAYANTSTQNTEQSPQRAHPAQCRSTMRRGIQPRCPSQSDSHYAAPFQRFPIPERCCSLQLC